MASNDKTVFDPGATKPESSTVYEGAATIRDSAGTVVDGGTTLLDAALSDAAAQDNVPPAENAAIRKGETILDTYTVESDAIEGGMVSVWRVHHKGWNVDLAMKRPQPQCFSTEKSKADFIHECEAWINLGLHPNIVSCYYVREIGGTPTIFSEWMDGGSLEDAINKSTLYMGTEAEQQERILDIAIQFARGLHYAHEAGLIHQDVKPDNLLLTKEGEAKVADFGLARARAVLTVQEGEPTMNDTPDAGKTILSPSGGYTPAYCSMEQMDGKELTRRTDIYSWAVSVMEMYISSRPWANGVVAGLGCRGYFENTRVPMLEALKELLAQCMDAEPENRPHDFAEIEAKLHEIYKTETDSSYPRSMPKAAADTADSLNNRALSMLDLGKGEEAETLWKRALTMDQHHMLAAYNRWLFSWRCGHSSMDTAKFALQNMAKELHKEAQAESLIHALILENGAEDIETCCVWDGGYDRHDSLYPPDEAAPYTLFCPEGGSEILDEKSPFHGKFRRFFRITDVQSGRMREYKALVDFDGKNGKPYVDASGLICFRKKRYSYPAWGPLAPYELSRVESFNERRETEREIAARKKEINAALAINDVSGALVYLEQLKDLCGRHLPTLFETEEKAVSRYCRVTGLKTKYEITTLPCRIDTTRSTSIPEYVKLNSSLRRQLKNAKIICTASSADGARFYLCGGKYALLALNSQSGEVLYAEKCDSEYEAAEKGHDVLIPYLHDGKNYLATNRCRMDERFNVIESVDRHGNRDICLCDKSGIFITTSATKHTIGHSGNHPTPRRAGFSDDGRYATECKLLTAHYYYDYTYMFPGWTNWDEGAMPYLQGFMLRHPSWTEEDFTSLITDLQNSGLGYIRPEGVRAKLEEMRPKKTGFGLFRKEK